MSVPQTMSVAEAAKRYGCSKDTIRDRAKKKAFKAYRPGKAVRIDIASADAWFLATAKTV